MTRIEAKNISYSDIFDDVNLTLEAGTLNVLLAPSAAGKTTLMKILCGELIPSKGTINASSEIIWVHQQTFHDIDWRYHVTLDQIIDKIPKIDSPKILLLDEPCCERSAPIHVEFLKSMRKLCDAGSTLLLAFALPSGPLSYYDKSFLIKDKKVKEYE